MRNIIIVSCLLFSPLLRAESLNYNVVSLSTTVQESVQNDTMQVTFSIEEQGHDRVTVSNAVTERSNRVLQYLRGKKSLNSQLSARHAYPSYIDNNPKNGTIWHDSIHINVDSKNIDELSQAIAQVQKDAAVSQLTFTVSNKRQNEINERLLTRAIEQFRNKAKTITKAMGGSNYKIINMDINENGRVMTHAATRMLKSAESAMMEIESGNSEVGINISGSIQVQ